MRFFCSIGFYLFQASTSCRAEPSVKSVESLDAFAPGILATGPPPAYSAP
jgi:hypothetical protein